MSEELQERKDMDPAYMWDLSSLYKDDEAWKADLPNLKPLVEEAASYKGKLKDAKTIREYLDLDQKLERKLSDLFEYAQLRRCEDTRAADAQQMYAQIYGMYVQALSVTAFAAPEILSLPEDELKQIAEDPVLSDYHLIMQDLLLDKPHTLTADQESLLANFGEVFGAPGNISETLMDADMTFEDALDSNGEKHPVTEAGYIELEGSEDRTLRENAFHSFYKSYKGHINTLAATYSAQVKASCAEARVRHYDSSRQMSMASEHIPEKVYDNLIEAVRRHMPAMYRYVALRKRMLGVDELHYYDLYAPLVSGVDRQYSYETAQQMVLEAVAPLGEDYVSVVKDAFKSHWIDVYPNKGKRSGAFSSGTYDSTPFILTNYTGSLESVSTIAHEMGHSMHTYLAKHAQPSQYADYTMFVAEIASTVNENLLVENLLSKTEDPKERLSLLNQYLENFKGTVYRQTMFAEFEKRAHEIGGRGESLDPQTLNAIYAELTRDYFGPDLVMDAEVQYEWSRIPHFYRPFYVYVYATGYSSAVALSEAIRKEGAPAAKRYKEFLSMGSSLHPLDELAHAGVDMNTPEPIDEALTKFESVLDEAEKMADQLGM